MSAEPAVGAVDLGDLGRVHPIDPYYGFARGTPVDRPLIEGFLERHAADVRGSVLEVQDPGYTRRFGGDRVTESVVLDVDPANPGATLVADLGRPEDFPPERFDCVLCTQTLQFVYDLRAAVRSLHRTLRPGGVLLLTAPGISQLDRHQSRATGEYWRFTTCSLRRLLEEAFPPEGVEVEGRGNVLAAVAFLHGLALEDLPAGALHHDDPVYPLVVAARCVRG